MIVPDATVGMHTNEIDSKRCLHSRVVHDQTMAIDNKNSSMPIEHSHSRKHTASPHREHLRIRIGGRVLYIVLIGNMPHIVAPRREKPIRWLRIGSIDRVDSAGRWVGWHA